MRRVLRVLALSGVIGVSAAGAVPLQPRVAFKQFPGPRNGIVLVDQSGGNAVDLTLGKPMPLLEGEFSWAPDGSRLAYAGGSSLNPDLYVLGVDGGDLTRLTFDGGGNRVFDNDPAWSPDGTRIAYLRSTRVHLSTGVLDRADEIWIVDADGRNAHALTHDGGQKSGPSWSPNGARVLYTRGATTKSGLYIVDARSGVAALFVPGVYVGTWAPDGTRLAVQDSKGIAVINADGTGRRTVALDAGGANWSPDGTRIAFFRTRLFQENRYYATRLSSVYVVSADGSGERRLTGPLLGEKNSTREGTPEDTSWEPVWWPDGSRLFFGERDQEHVMNADGSCEQPFGPTRLFLGAPAWRPGAPPSLPPTRCVALGGIDTPLRDPVGVRDTARVRITVANDGNETATDVVLTARLELGRGEIRMDDSSCHASAPGVECDLEPIAPGSFVELLATVARPSPPVIHVETHLRATEPSGATVSVTGVAYVGVRKDCDIVGTVGHDTIVGTPRPDRICALPGPDRILVRGGGRDTVDCGSGKDIVVADRRDVVAENCERVIRR
jgi:Tol biopolymer transport system component